MNRIGDALRDRRRLRHGTRPGFIESRAGPFARGLDLASRMPTPLVAIRCPTTVHRHLKAKKARNATSRSRPCRRSKHPDSTRRRSCAHRQSPVAQQRCRTSFEDRAKRPRRAMFRGVARRSRTVVKGRRRKRSRDGTVHEAADHGGAASRVRPRRMPSEPAVHLWLGASVSRTSSLFLLRPSTRPRPSRVRPRSPAPRGLFTPVLDVRSSFKPRRAPPPRSARSRRRASLRAAAA